MKIAILAWGSLLWNQGDIKLNDKWQKTNFSLPLAYSRICENRNGRITLVLDKANGSDAIIYYATIDANNLDIAIKQLKERERTTSKNIGYINIGKKSFRTQILDQNDLLIISKWSVDNGFDGVIWTDLATNWETIRGIPFNVVDAKKYLDEKKNNDVNTYNKSMEYIVNAYNWNRERRNTS